MTGPGASIQLVAKRGSLLDGRPDYSVYAGSQRIGRIYCQLHNRANAEQWFWGVQGVFTTAEIGRLHGLAPSLDDAKAKLRSAFDVWLAFALAAPASHLSYDLIQRNLQAVGAR